MRKKHHNKHKNKDEDCKVNEEFAEQIFKEVLERAKERRVLIRKPTGEVVAEMPVVAGIFLTVVFTIFLFPVVIIALIAGYKEKVRLDIITEISDEEATRIEQLEHQQTVTGKPYETGDGQPTLIQNV